METSSYSFGLIGYPLGHSFSPALHQAALRAQSLQGEYVLYAIPPSPAGTQELETLLQQMHRGEIHGLNVTIPHKERIIEHLDGLTATAEAIGAVNLVYLRSGRLIGDNVDAPAFIKEVSELGMLANAANKMALVLGAGGAARAAVYALLQAGWKACVAARRLDQAERLAGEMGPEVKAIELEKTALTEMAASCDLIVNATPLGMAPDVDASPWPEDLDLPPTAAVYDLVYNPPVTKLIAAARRQGIKAETGGGMLVEQAALAFERWTRLEAPRQAMTNALHKQSLEEQWSGIT